MRNILFGSALAIASLCQAQPLLPNNHDVRFAHLQRQALAQMPHWRAPHSRSATLPSYVDNSLNSYFPAVFNQKGNSCSQASGVRYAFTYEMNRMLNRPSDGDERVFSYHFTWNFLNEGNDSGSFPSSGYDLIKESGAMTLADMPDESAAVSMTTWATGYDKYIRAMHYRAKGYSKIELKTQEGINRLKRYLYDHGTESASGGVATFSCKTSNWKESYYSGPSEASTEINYMIRDIGTEGAHALTIVGYDDTFQSDLNSDGQITSDEHGAFIFVNSWGTYWGAKGKCYYPYAYFLRPASAGGLADTDATACIVEPASHTPRFVFKINASYTSRNDLRFRMGVAEGQQSKSPTITHTPAHFLNQGGDYMMRGDGGDLFRHIEFALDFTDAAPQFASFTDPKFFLEVYQGAIGKEKGSGTINSFSVIDLQTGTTYSGFGTQTSITPYLKLYTGAELLLLHLSAQRHPWLTNEGAPRTQLFLFKTAEGKKVKTQFLNYDKANGSVTLRYQPLN